MFYRLYFVKTKPEFLNEKNTDFPGSNHNRRNEYDRSLQFQGLLSEPYPAALHYTGSSRNIKAQSSSSRSNRPILRSFAPIYRNLHHYANISDRAKINAIPLRPVEKTLLRRIRLQVINGKKAFYIK